MKIKTISYRWHEFDVMLNADNYTFHTNVCDSYLASMRMDNLIVISKNRIDSFIEKWFLEKERIYSKDEVINILRDVYDTYSISSSKNFPHWEWWVDKDIERFIDMNIVFDKK